MTSQPAYPGYATPVFDWHDGICWVAADPWNRPVGRVFDEDEVGWTAYTNRGHYVGLYPDQQAAGEALVKHAGYEVLR